MNFPGKTGSGVYSAQTGHQPQTKVTNPSKFSLACQRHYWALLAEAHVVGEASSQETWEASGQLRHHKIPPQHGWLPPHSCRHRIPRPLNLPRCIYSSTSAGVGLHAPWGWCEGWLWSQLRVSWPSPNHEGMSQGPILWGLLSSDLTCSDSEMRIVIPGQMAMSAIVY